MKKTVPDTFDLCDTTESNPAVNFVLPVRHHDTMSNWDAVVERMSHTVASLVAQTSPNWRATIIANAGTILPTLPPQFKVVRVDFAPARLPDEKLFPAEFYRAIRLDKGRRVESGLKNMDPAEYTMLLDYDDLVHRELVDFLERHSGENGWCIHSGYFFDGGSILFKTKTRFSEFCGSSHIINTRLYLPTLNAAVYGEDYIMRALGSHRSIASDLALAGYPLKTLPFPGAVYRMGYVGNTSRSGSIRTWLFGLKTSLGHPVRAAGRLLSLRKMTSEIERDFFAGDFRMGEPSTVRSSD